MVHEMDVMHCCMSQSHGFVGFEEVVQVREIVMTASCALAIAVNLVTKRLCMLPLLDAEQTILRQ